MFSRVLVPVDFSDRAKIAVHHAAYLAEATGSKLELLHVIEDAAYSYPLIWPGEAPLLVDLHVQAKANATAGMEDLVRQFKKEKVPVFPVIKTGIVVDTIRDHAKEVSADLIVTATHGRTGLDRLLLGSVSERLLRNPPCPILVARGDLNASRPMQKITVAVDLSPHSRRALELAANIAKHFGASVEVFHVWPAPYPLAEIKEADDIFSKLCRAAEAAVADFLNGSTLPAGVSVTTVIASGVPTAAINDHLAESAPDLLCVGTHGYAGFKHMLLGSVAEAVLRCAPCPTLVVPL